MRYEALVAHPGDEWFALWEFLGLPFDEAMLRHEENFKPRKGPNGTILHARVGLPITRGLRNCRMDMKPAELGRFEAAAGPFLDELGYPRAVEQPRPDDLAHVAAIRRLFEVIASNAGRIPLAMKK